MYEMLSEFIKPELIILVPVMYLIGIGIKKSNIPNCVIPLILGFASILLSLMFVISTSYISSTEDILLAVFTGITQGILCAGASVYINQLIKQFKKND